MQIKTQKALFCQQFSTQKALSVNFCRTLKDVCAQNVPAYNCLQNSLCSNLKAKIRKKNQKGGGEGNRARFRTKAH